MRETIDIKENEELLETLENLKKVALELYQKASQRVDEIRLKEAKRNVRK